MANTLKEWRRLLEFRVGVINKHTGSDYKIDYCGHYGGWEMYVVNKENGGHGRGRFGFDVRMKSPEFYAYLEGIIKGLGIW